MEQAKHIGGNTDRKCCGLYSITAHIEGGILQAVYITLPVACNIEVELIDLDNAEADGDNPDALDEARTRLAVVENEQRQIY